MSPRVNKLNPAEHFRSILDSELKSKESTANVTRILYNAKVIENSDPENSSRIKVRIYSVDAGISDENLPWCIPFFPSHFQTIPKIGEHVLIIVANPWNPSVGRYYTGPVFSSGNSEEEYSDTLSGLRLVNNEKG